MLTLFCSCVPVADSRLCVMASGIPWFNQTLCNFLYLNTTHILTGFEPKHFAENPQNDVKKSTSLNYSTKVYVSRTYCAVY